MSQLFGMNEDNNIGIRVNDIKANNVYQKNEITGEYERLSSGGSGPGELPYYLKSNTIDIDSGTNGSELSATGLIIGDSSGNETLDKNKLSILSNLKTNIVDLAPGSFVSPFPVSYNQTTNTFQRLAIMFMGTNSTYTKISGTDILINASGFGSLQLAPSFLKMTHSLGTTSIDRDCLISLRSIVDNTVLPALGTGDLGKYIVSYNKNTNTFERAANITFGTTNTNSQYGTTGIILNNFASKVELYWNLLRFTASGITYDLKKEDITIVNNLYNPSLITPTASNKMIVFNPTTKVYNYAAIPTGSFEPKLSYKIVNGDEFLRCELGETTDSITPILDDPKPVSTFTNIMLTGEKMILDFTKGGTVYYPAKTYTWYNIKLNPVSSFNSRFIFNVTPDIGKITGGDYASKDYDVYVRKLPKSITFDGSTMDVNSYLFKIVDKFAGSSTPQLFAGSLIVECVTTDYTSGVSL